MILVYGTAMGKNVIGDRGAADFWKYVEKLETASKREVVQTAYGVQSREYKT